MTRYEKIVQTLGKMPEKTEPEIMLLGKTDMGCYVMQDVTYLVEPGERIRAHLLIPKTASAEAPVPAIVAMHYHGGFYHIGKSGPVGLGGDPMYFYGKELACRGFAVICPDHFCFGERRPSDEELERIGVNKFRYELLVFNHAIIKGSTLQAKYLSDLTVAVDVLASFDFVDGSNIGTIGASLGGQEAFWFTYYDKRIKAGVPVCGLSTVEAVLKHHQLHNMALYTFGMLDAGDNFAMVEQMAEDGKALMMINGTDDAIFPIDGVYAVHEYAAKAYSKAGIPEKFVPVTFEGGHMFPDDIRPRAYDFLERHLYARTK